MSISYLEHGEGRGPDLGPDYHDDQEQSQPVHVLLEGGRLGVSDSVHTNIEGIIGTQNGKVPLISWVQAGAWDEAIDTLHPGEAEAWLPCPVKHGARTYALRIKGDSMTAPYGKSYPEGSVIYVDPDQAGGVTTGDRVIAKMMGENAVTFKAFIEDAGKRYLKPLNPAYPLILDPFSLLGKVILKMEFE